MSMDSFVERIFGLKDENGKKRPTKIVAPMVRYSKLPFRLLAYKYSADLCFTPMIVAESFNQSQKARDSEFKTNEFDRPLVVQFAAKDPIHFGLAAQKVAKYADAVDLNCGCPQKWAMSEGLGASMIKNPQLIKEMVVAAKEMSGGLPTSVKIRVEDDLRKTVDLIRTVEQAGVAWITVHGRTARQFTRVPVNLDAIKLAKEHATVPIVANGDIFQPGDVDRVAAHTGVDGVMSARGMLANPALYAGYAVAPTQCAVDYLKLALDYGGSFVIHHHHLLYLLYGSVSPADRAQFRQLSSLNACVEFMRARDWWTPADDAEWLGVGSDPSDESMRMKMRMRSCGGAMIDEAAEATNAWKEENGDEQSDGQVDEAVLAQSLVNSSLASSSSPASSSSSTTTTTTQSSSTPTVATSSKLPVYSSSAFKLPSLADPLADLIDFNVVKIAR